MKILEEAFQLLKLPKGFLTGEDGKGLKLDQLKLQS